MPRTGVGSLMKSPGQRGPGAKSSAVCPPIQAEHAASVKQKPRPHWRRPGQDFMGTSHAKASALGVSVALPVYQAIEPLRVYDSQMKAPAKERDRGEVVIWA
jgi:hypothetical protein